MRHLGTQYLVIFLNFYVNGCHRKIWKISWNFANLSSWAVRRHQWTPTSQQVPHSHALRWLQGSSKCGCVAARSLLWVPWTEPLASVGLVWAGAFEFSAWENHLQAAPDASWKDSHSLQTLGSISIHKRLIDNRGTHYKYLNNLVQEILESQISGSWRALGGHDTPVPSVYFSQCWLSSKKHDGAHRSAVHLKFWYCLQVSCPNTRWRSTWWWSDLAFGSIILTGIWKRVSNNIICTSFTDGQQRWRWCLE